MKILHAELQPGFQASVKIIENRICYNLVWGWDFMTKTVSIEQVKNSVQAVIALTSNGDEIVLEENGEPIVKVVPISKPENKKRIPGLGKGYFMSDDFNDELPDEFWGFDKDL